MPLESGADAAGHHGVGGDALRGPAPARLHRNELAAVCDAVPPLLAELPPLDATRTWMHRFIDYMTTKIGMADALRLVIASGGDPYAQSRDLLDAAIERLLDAGVATGEYRTGVLPDDVLIGLSGIALAAGEPSQRAQAGRLIDLMLDGLRHRSQA
ncbi:hypothetical protein Sm713_53420 [Streptomyces sp. TS71-3]|nr:hypothetical protein Sm713_53420 [Streptomyces sp. TS71-3]